MNPNYCPVNYRFAISPTITTTSVVAFDSSTRTFTVQSNDLSLAKTYTIIVTAYSPNNAALSSTLGFSLTLVNPYLTSFFTIDRSIIATETNYNLADPEFNFPVLNRTKITPSNSLATCPTVQVDI